MIEDGRRSDKVARRQRQPLGRAAQQSMSVQRSSLGGAAAGGLTREARAQLLALRGHAHGAVVGVADARHDAAGGNHGHRAEAVLVGAQGGGDQHVAPRAHAAVAAQHHALAQPVGGQRLVRLQGQEGAGGRGGGMVSS